MAPPILLLPKPHKMQAHLRPIKLSLLQLLNQTPDRPLDAARIGTVGVSPVAVGKDVDADLFAGQWVDVDAEDLVGQARDEDIVDQLAETALHKVAIALVATSSDEVVQAADAARPEDLARPRRKRQLHLVRVELFGDARQRLEAV